MIGRQWLAGGGRRRCRALLSTCCLPLPSPSPLPPLPPQLKVTEFGQLRSTLQAAARKQTGSLAVRDLSSLVPASSLVNTGACKGLLLLSRAAAVWAC